MAVRVLHDGDVQWGRGMDDIFCAGDAAAWPHSMADGDLIRIEQHDVEIQAVGLTARAEYAEVIEIAPDEKALASEAVTSAMREAVA